MDIRGIEDLDLYSADPKGKDKIEVVLSACIESGIYQVYANGYDLPLRSCILEYKMISSKLSSIFGEENLDLPKRWFLTLKERSISVDMPALKSALIKACKERDEEY